MARNLTPGVPLLPSLPRRHQSMLVKLSDHITHAQEHAITCPEYACEAIGKEQRLFWLKMEAGWMRLVESYMFQEHLHSFIRNRDHRG